MTKAEALHVFNQYLIEHDCQPLTEKDAIDVIWEDMTEKEALEAASDWVNEEHTTKCENKFWENHDWQQD